MKTGPKRFLTVSSRASTFSITMQHTSSLPRWKPMTASLSLGFIFAFSLRSFGRTICPLASTVTIASILKHSLLQHSLVVICFHKERTCKNIYTFLIIKNYLTITTEQGAK